MKGRAGAPTRPPQRRHLVPDDGARRRAHRPLTPISTPTCRPTSRAPLSRLCGQTSRAALRAACSPGAAGPAETPLQAAPDIPPRPRRAGACCGCSAPPIARLLLGPAAAGHPGSGGLLSGRAGAVADAGGALAGGRRGGGCWLVPPDGYMAISGRLAGAGRWRRWRWTLIAFTLLLTLSGPSVNAVALYMLRC